MELLGNSVLLSNSVKIFGFSVRISTKFPEFLFGSQKILHPKLISLCLRPVVRGLST
jgi:hypothetical protein